MAVSETFNTMFSNPMHEESSAAAVVNIPYPTETFMTVLNYIYTGEVEEAADPVSLLDAASYFCLDRVKESAVAHLRGRTTTSNTFDMLAVAMQFRCEQLRDHCVTLIRQHNTEVLHTPRWTSLPLNVALLLVQETVIDGELEIVRKAAEWCLANVPSHDSLTELDALAISGNDRSARSIETAACNAASGSVGDATTLSECCTPRCSRLSSSLSTPSVHGAPDDADAALTDRQHQWFTWALTKFLRFVDFTKMTLEEVEEVERMRHVPLEMVYRAFKCRALDLPLPHTPRNGGIVLQWEFSQGVDVAFADNHVAKVSSDYEPKAVHAINRFNRGRHYFTFQVEEFRSPHDCLVGVTCKGGANHPGKEYHFEPCCNTVCAPPGTLVVPGPPAITPLIVDHRCIIGVLLDFEGGSIQWFNHATKHLLFTATPLPEVSEESSAQPDTPGALPTPLCPSVILYHKSNGGVILGESTSFLKDPAKIPTPSGGQTPKLSSKNPSPSKSPGSNRLRRY
jgi:hypothetical protein